MNLRTFVFAPLCASLLFSGCNCGQRVSRVPSDLEVQPLVIDFGAQPAGSTSALPFTIANRGKTAAGLVPFEIRGDARVAFEAPAGTRRLEPGETLTFQLTYRAPATAGDDTATLVVSSGDDTAEVLVTLSATSLVCSTGDACAPSGTDSGLAPAPDAGVPDSGVPIVTPDAGAPDAGHVPFDAGSSEVVLIPTATFVMGCNTALDVDCELNERPAHSVTLSAFSIDRFEVTQAQYQACLDAAACSELPTAMYNPALHPSWPVSAVSWGAAVTWCAWKGKRLPTEAEWEYAARGTNALIYPWGNAPPPNCASMADMMVLGQSACDNVPSDIGSFPVNVSPSGVRDMAGGAWEWVSDWYGSGYYSTGPSTDPKGPSTGTQKMARGGGFQSSEAKQLRTSFRGYPSTVGSVWTDVGFRCAQ